MVPGEDEKTCIRQMEDIVKSLGLEGKVDIRLKPRSSPYMKSFSLEPTDPLVTTLQSKFKAVTGEDLPVAYDPSVCDSNIPSRLAGHSNGDLRPSGGGMHAANEYGFPWQVTNCAEVYKQTVKELLR